MSLKRVEVSLKMGYFSPVTGRYEHMNLINATQMLLTGRKLKHDFERAKAYAQKGDIEKARAASLCAIDGAERILRLSRSPKVAPLRKLAYQVLQSARLLAGQLELDWDADGQDFDIDDIDFIDLDLDAFSVEDVSPTRKKRKKRRSGRSIYGYSK